MSVPDRRTRFRSRLLTISLGLAVAGGVAFGIDVPVARWLAVDPLPGDATRLLDLTEFAAHGSGVAALMASLLVLDPGLRFWHSDRPWAFARMVAAVVAGGMMADVGKFAIHRVRPRSADLASLDSGLASFISDVAPWAEHVGEIRSFPSGHAAVASATAAALCWRYPHGWPVFVSVAAAACAQRLACGAHYTSDVAFGAALGLLGAALFLGASVGDRALMVRSRETC